MNKIIGAEIQLTLSVIHGIVIQTLNDITNKFSIHTQEEVRRKKTVSFV